LEKHNASISFSYFIYHPKNSLVSFEQISKANFTNSI